MHMAFGADVSGPRKYTWEGPGEELPEWFGGLSPESGRPHKIAVMTEPA